ncbi:MAG: ABC transporter ATP-binding protein [Bacteroidota bacterium]|jgi:ABC transporter, ATP-binding protein sagG
MNVIETFDLCKRYRNATDFALRDLSLHVAEGEFYGILGENGAGKTTLMSILFGSIAQTSGRFEICGLSYDTDADSIRRQIGIVPQEYALYPTLTARENLQYFGSLYHLKGKQLNSLIDDALAIVGLSGEADRRVEHLSGGMKRRINLVAGTLHSPRLLFLDEPNVGVDVVSKSVIIDYLKDLNRRGVSILYSSHHLLEAQELCHRIGILSGGSLIAEDTPQKIIADYNVRNLEDLFLSLRN